MICDACIKYLNNLFEDWEDDVSQDDMLSHVQMLAYCKKKLSAGQYGTLNALVEAATKKVKTLTAWRIDGTLREFPKFAPVNLWFDYPVHLSDASGVLNDIQPDAEKAPWQRGKEARKKQGEQQREMKVSKYNMAIENFRFEHNDQYPTVKELFELMKSDAEAVGEKYPAEKTVRNSLKELGYDLEKGTGRICPTP